jgi:8-oxo-dGTP pyrophosphatase MutT (NUDIX family)
MLDLLARCPDPFARGRFEPGHFTASAFVASSDLAATLMIRHPRLGRWLQPGGHVEPGDDDLLETARREVAEETGLDDLVPEPDGPFDLDIHRIPAGEHEPAHLHFDVRFRFRVATDRPARIAGAHETRWFPVASTLREDGSGSMRRVLDKWFNGRPSGRKEFT